MHNVGLKLTEFAESVINPVVLNNSYAARCAFQLHLNSLLFPSVPIESFQL